MFKLNSKNKSVKMFKKCEDLGEKRVISKKPIMKISEKKIKKFLPTIEKNLKTKENR